MLHEGNAAGADAKPEGARSLWTEAKRIFGEALEQDPEKRPEYVARVCGTDSDLYREVLSLLENHGRADSFFERPPAGATAIPADPMLGRRIGGYKILRQIGLGGMGAVYLAERADDQFRKLVALKAVRPELFNEQAFRRFQNERQTLAVLDHPNIIKLLDGGTTEEGLPYLVTEYVEGQPIDRYAVTAGLNVRQRLELFRTLLGAVHYAHQHLVVHRDLKPGNIIVTPEGVPKLLDFGIAKVLQPEYSPHTMGLTQSNMQPMTPNFASPEQILGLPITTASDTYSLGVILYHLLTGHHPYERQMRTAFELGQAICETEPEKPSKFAERADLPVRGDGKLLRGDLDTIVLKAMRKEPQKRYASVEHFSEDIRRYLEGFPVLAQQSGVWYRASKFVGRHRATSAGVVLLTAGLIVASVVALQQKRAAERRFGDLRQFANFVLNDLDGNLRQGTTPARALLAKKGVEYLDQLALEKGSDPSIKRDLVNGYIKNGDVKGNLYGASLGETAGAEDSYRKALKYAEELVRADASNLEDRLTLALAHMKLGEVLATSGNRSEAMKHYDEAFHINDATKDSGTPDWPALREEAQLWADLGSAHAFLSDPAGALDCYGRALQTTERFPAAHPQTKAHDLAFDQERVAYYTALTGGDAAGAEATIGESIETYKVMAAKTPTADRRRDLAQAYETLAEVQQLAGESAEALASIRLSLPLTEALLAEDPKDEPTRIDRQQGLMEEIELLAANNRTEETRAETRSALEFMKPLAEQSDQFQHAEDYAQLLATTHFDELRDDKAALKYGRKAVMMTHGADPEVLHVLALAYERNGDKQLAIDADRKALKLLPAGPSVFRTTLDAEISRLSQ